MKAYEKPTVIPADDLAEGVFASSGTVESTAGTNIEFNFVNQSAWTSETGQQNYHATVPSDFVGKTVVITVEFTESIKDAWIDGAEKSWNGKTASFNYYNIGSEVDLHYQEKLSNTIKSANIKIDG